MLKHKLHLVLAVLAVIALSSCTQGGNPIVLDPYLPFVHQAALVDILTARFNSVTGETWVGAPMSTSMPESEVSFFPSDGPAHRMLSLKDGSFIYHFPGSRDSEVTVYWTDTAGASQQKKLTVTEPASELMLNVAEAGKFPNRLNIVDDVAWVVNSGDNNVISYNLDTLGLHGSAIAPPNSNPWEVAFATPDSGILTTLFGGVIAFDQVNGDTNVTSIGFRSFASPNGCAVDANGNGWITNPNPISYFPSEMGQGWVSKVDTATHSVIAEIDTEWFNPQYVIARDKYIYVSCSGTIDFQAPDYLPVALDGGGVMVIDIDTGEVVNSYDLGYGGPGPMAISPDGTQLYVGSAVAGWLFRIDLENQQVENDADDPIIISDTAKTYVSFVKINSEGLLVCGSFDNDTLRFLDSSTGELDPFPILAPIALHPGDTSMLYGIQDGAYCERNGEAGLLLLTTVKSGLHWLPI